MRNSIMHYHKYYQIPNCPEFTPKSRSNCNGGIGHRDGALPEDWKMLNKADCNGKIVITRTKINIVDIGRIMEDAKNIAIIC